MELRANSSLKRQSSNTSGKSMNLGPRASQNDDIMNWSRNFIKLDPSDSWLNPMLSTAGNSAGNLLSRRISGMDCNRYMSNLTPVPSYAVVRFDGEPETPDVGDPFSMDRRADVHAGSTGFKPFKQKEEETITTNTPQPKKTRSSLIGLLTASLDPSRNHPLLESKSSGEPEPSLVLTNSRSKKEEIEEPKFKAPQAPMALTLNRTRSRTSIHDLAYRMIEDGRLDVRQVKVLRLEDKVFISNILNIRNRDVFVDPNLPDKDFVAQINQNLGEAKEKRNDDQLRWMFKKATKQMLIDNTEYRRNKLFRREEYMGELTKIFFPKCPEMEKSLLDSSFASKKKLKSMFEASKKFKEDFLSFANDKIWVIHREESSKLYEEMYQYTLSRLKNRPADRKKPFLKDQFKRLPWRDSDVQNTIDQVNKLLKK